MKYLIDSLEYFIERLTMRFIASIDENDNHLHLWLDSPTPWGHV